jgi:4-amino-4-deoxy-L-arabinose transferase-like glycosyltransferase
LDPCLLAGMELSRPFRARRARDRAQVLTGRVPARALLCVLVVVITGLNLWWATLESRPPHWDMGHHLSNSLRYLDGFSLTDPGPFLTSYLFYPPLVYWVADAFYAVLGSEATTVALLSNAVWLAMLVFATFGIGRRLWNERVGWLSVAFVVTAPLVVSTSKEYMLDLPLTAVTALCLYLMTRADGFAIRRYSLLFGIALGCGLLVKWTLPLVLALPMIHVAAMALADARRRRSFGRALNLFGAGVLAFAVAGPWYVHNYVLVLGSAVAYGGADEAAAQGNPPARSLASATWYFWNLVDVQLYLLPTLFVLGGVVYCFRKREFAARNLYPLLVIIGGFAAFTLIAHKDPRYTLPLLPAIAVLGTSWLEYLSARTRAWAAGVLVAYGVVAFFAIGFGTSLLPKDLGVDLPATHGLAPTRLTVFAQHGYIVGPPTDEHWYQAEALRSMTAVPAAERTFTYEGPDTIWFNAWGLSYYAMRYDAEFATNGPARFLVYRGPLPSTPPGSVERERWVLPDGGTLAVYERAAAGP